MPGDELALGCCGRDGVAIDGVSVAVDDDAINDINSVVPVDGLR